jgi:hypothetical protein
MDHAQEKDKNFFLFKYFGKPSHKPHIHVLRRKLFYGASFNICFPILFIFYSFIY